MIADALATAPLDEAIELVTTPTSAMATSIPGQSALKPSTRRSVSPRHSLQISALVSTKKKLTIDTHLHKPILFHEARMRVYLPRDNFSAQVRISKVCVVGCCFHHGLEAGQSAVPMLDRVKRKQLDALDGFAFTVLFTSFKIRNRYQAARVSLPQPVARPLVTMHVSVSAQALGGGVGVLAVVLDRNASSFLQLCLSGSGIMLEFSARERNYGDDLFRSASPA